MTYWTVVHHGPEAVPDLRAQLVNVHVDARSDLLDQDFYTAERFAQRLDAYAEDPTFALVTMTVDQVLVGYAFGGTLSASTRWWKGLRDATDPDLTQETGTRTFAFRELLVRKAHQRRGYAHALHDELLAGRPEERATLLVRRDNPARELYLRWGWKVVGKMQPFPDSPVFDSMVLDLGVFRRLDRP
jgi:GNAT superfamily N-acetyltransferase